MQRLGFGLLPDEIRFQWENSSASAMCQKACPWTNVVPRTILMWDWDLLFRFPIAGPKRLEFMTIGTPITIKNEIHLIALPKTSIVSSNKFYGNFCLKSEEDFICAGGKENAVVAEKFFGCLWSQISKRVEKEGTSRFTNARLCEYYPLQQSLVQ